MTDLPKPFDHCSGCGYDLRASHSESTCPECGLKVFIEVDKIRRERAWVLVQVLTKPTTWFAISFAIMLIPIIWAVWQQRPGLPLPGVGGWLILVVSVPALIRRLYIAYREWGGWLGVGAALSVALATSVTMACALAFVFFVFAMFGPVFHPAEAVIWGAVAVITGFASIVARQRLLTYFVNQRLDALQGGGS